MSKNSLIIFIILIILSFFVGCIVGSYNNKSKSSSVFTKSYDISSCDLIIYEYQSMLREYHDVLEDCMQAYSECWKENYEN